MRRAVAVFLLMTMPAWAWDIGFNFRATSSFVTDPASTTWVVAGVTAYPTTRTVAGQTIVFGWETLTGAYLNRDRGTWADSRLAGINCQLNNGSPLVFRVDLPATGVYAVSVALGDGVGNNPMNNHVKVNSNNTTVLTLDVNSNNNFADATGALNTALLWPSANAAVQRTFSSTILRLSLGATSDSGYSCISHLRVVQMAPTSVPNPASRSFYLQ